MMRVPFLLSESAAGSFASVRSSLLTFTAFLAVGIVPLHAQNPDDVLNFDVSEEGPWSDLERTTVVVPQIPDGSVEMDGLVSSKEYGGTEGTEVLPGINAWILDFPGDRSWDAPEDSSFTFWLAHDSANLYVGVEVKDDVVNSDNEPAALWKDDSIEIVIDALNDDYDNNTDNSSDLYGGHCYISFDGRFSEWDPDGESIIGTRWSSGVDWSFGEEDGKIWTKGEEVEGGWQLEARFPKVIFEDPDAGNKLEDGYVMGFNIGVDDDDKRGPEGDNGNGERERDLELQYFWANRARLLGWNETEAEEYSEEQIASGEHLEDFDTIIDSTGRLSHGGAGDIVFGGPGGRSLPFQITDFVVSEKEGNTEVELQWSSKSGKSYTVESAEDVQEWIELADGIESGGATTSYTQPNAQTATGALYFRVREE